MIKWKVERWHDDIHRIECLSETEKTVMLPSQSSRGKPRRENKVTDYHQYFDSWDEAHAELLARLEGEAEGARIRITRVNASLDRVRAMTEPGDGEV